MAGEIMTIRQVAEYLQMSPSNVYHLVNKGELPGRKIGGVWRFVRSEIDGWIAGGQRPIPLDILVVEDEPPVCQLFVETLKPRGHFVYTALTGEEGLKQIESRFFDLIFLDLSLPGISGIDVYSRICQLSCPSEVIVITSFSSSHLLTKALERGLLTVIQKPFRIKTIMEAVEKVAQAKAGFHIS